ncbi:MAG TPA: hypothetical protein PKM78_02355 [Anaerolineae bacterium]|nr:hypothetical protein [Anaerolineae bacterium]HNU04639.1 hypothetical protein [Anaerolineae bacterium]
MLKLNAKQWVLIAVCFAVAAVVNYLIWLIAMGNPSEISAFYHVLNTLCLGSAFLVVADRFMKTQIYR